MMDNDESIPIFINEKMPQNYIQLYELILYLPERVTTVFFARF